MVYFQDDLWGNAIFLKEANAISVELRKKVCTCLVSMYMYTLHRVVSVLFCVYYINFNNNVHVYVCVCTGSVPVHLAD